MKIFFLNELFFQVEVNRRNNTSSFNLLLFLFAKEWVIEYTCKKKHPKLKQYKKLLQNNNNQSL